MSAAFTLDKLKIDNILAKTEPPQIKDVERILKDAQGREINLEEGALLLSAIKGENFKAIRDRVIDASKILRRRYHGDGVHLMAPVEVTNRCASNCRFCGWRADNVDMKRMSISPQVLKLQVDYLLDKGIKHIELVGGDDMTFVRKSLPQLIQLITSSSKFTKGHVLSFCTMALTETQYRHLHEQGAGAMIMWQETYDRDVYQQHITHGPKACGVNDQFQVIKGGDGYTFRLQSQDRAAAAGLGLSVGAILGLNPNYEFEILATIEHAAYLVTTYEPEKPVIVGMPTWNHITTPKTCNRPAEMLPVEDLFTYFACIYFLALDKKKTWTFPNCRVSIQTQVEAVLAAGAFTSTEVKLGPAGYLPSVLRDASTEDRVRVYETLQKEIKANPDLADIETVLDNMEQFRHHYHLHEEYVERFKQRGLQCV